MNKFFVALALIWGSSAFAITTEELDNSLLELIPGGYVVTDTIYGDLNKDNQNDVVLLIKNIDPSNVVIDQYRGELDRNRRGVIVAIRNKNVYELAVKNVRCFSSENEDGGVYFAPELNISIDKGSLYFHYMHGRYGYWRYNFRYHGTDFELIGYDKSENRGPVVEKAVSINFLTNKMVIKRNVNQYAEFEDEVFKETWHNFTLAEPYKLNQITDFDRLDIESSLLIVDIISSDKI
jgi:hypothetical protein